MFTRRQSGVVGFQIQEAIVAKDKNDALPVVSVDEELKALELEEKKLRVKQLKRDISRMEAQDAQRAAAAESQQRSLDDANEQILRTQKMCLHRKGGKGLPGILNGQDSNYAVNHHTYPNGDVGIVCQRCIKWWYRPGSRIQQVSDPSGFAAQAASRAEYERQLAEYNEAAGWPTDNEASGSQIFVVTETRGRQRQREAVAS